MQNLLNCYIKETGRGEWQKQTMPGFTDEHESILTVPFDSQSVTLYIPVCHRSETGRHIFSEEMYYRLLEGELQHLDFLALTHFIQKDLDEMTTGNVQVEEFMLRTILSYQTMEGNFSCRSRDYNAVRQIRHSCSRNSLFLPVISCTRHRKACRELMKRNWTSICRRGKGLSSFIISRQKKNWLKKIRQPGTGPPRLSRRS